MDGSDGAHNPKVHEGLVAVPVSGDLDRGPPTLSSATSDERLHGNPVDLKQGGDRTVPETTVWGTGRLASHVKHEK